MPNIDTSTIQGYAEMTPEQKIAALEALEIPEAVDLTEYVKKSVFDNKASEAASWKKKHDDLLSEDERKKQQDADELQDLKDKLENLQKEKDIADYTAKYIALGYDEKLAKETAEAMQSGNMAKVFENGEKHKTALEAKIKADLMKSDPKPGGTGGDEGDKSVVLEQAKQIGKAKAEADKKTAEVTKYYIK